MSTVSDRPVFIYWDNPNIYIASQKVAEEKEGHEARFRVHIQFDHLHELASAGRKVQQTFAVGPVSPELKILWTSLENTGVEVELENRTSLTGEEQGVDQALEVCMLKDGLKHINNPGIIVLLTGDGRGIQETLNLLYERGWGIEVLSWKYSCSKAMREWVEDVGQFVVLDDYYDQITFLDPLQSGESFIPPRYFASLDLSKREMLAANK